MERLTLECLNIATYYSIAGLVEILGQRVWDGRRGFDAKPYTDSSRRPNTAGAAIASIAKTKK